MKVLNTLGPKHSQRGVALITAILVVALATILAVSVASDGFMDQRRTMVMLGVDQAYEAALGAEAIAAAGLALDFQQKQSRSGNVTDSLSDEWAKPQILPFEDMGQIRGNLEDLQGRFNINNLVASNGTIDTDMLAVFTSLLQRLGIETRWAGLIADWLDADNNPNFPDGAEDSIYTLRRPPYLAANRPLLSTSELLAVVDSSGQPFGMTRYSTLEPYISALPLETPLNVCTAPAEVLDAMAPSAQEFSTSSGKSNMVASRKSGCFPHITDVRTAFQSRDPQFDALMLHHANYLSERTKFFRANIFVQLGSTEIAMYSVLQRTGNGSTVHVISRSLGSP